MGWLSLKGKGQFWGECGASHYNLWEGALLHSCVEVHELIELSFGVVKGVGPGINVWNGSPHGSRGRVDFVVVCPHWPNGLNGLIFKINVFDSCVKSWEYFRMHSISLESIGFSKMYSSSRSMLGFTGNMQKYNSFWCFGFVSAASCYVRRGYNVVLS